jgi:hypothetical protein
MIRDILDYNGNVIGQLELPDDTPEEIWAATLAKYVVVPLSLAEKYERKLEQQRLLAPKVTLAIRLYMIQNLLSLADAAVIYHELTPELLAVNNGAFEVAINMLQSHTPSGPVTQNFINFCIQTLQPVVVPLE